MLTEKLRNNPDSTGQREQTGESHRAVRTAPYIQLHNSVKDCVTACDSLTVNNTNSVNRV